MVPSLAIFPVSVETDFYDRYREYYGVATKHGTLRQVLMALAPWIAAGLGLDRLQVAILRCGPVGAVLHVLCLFGGIVLLYFDRRRAAALTVLVGPRAYGLGYPLAALLGCAWAYPRLEETLADLEYLTFAAQPMVPEAPAVESSHPASA